MLQKYAYIPNPLGFEDDPQVRKKNFNICPTFTETCMVLSSTETSIISFHSMQIGAGSVVVKLWGHAHHCLG